MTQLRSFFEVDVFTDFVTPQSFSGNPLAVVMDGLGLETAQMQQIANWTNFSETTFLLPPTLEAADYQVRIFTPTMELPFAGHPTLGSCHAFLEHGGKPKSKERIVQQCAIGLITIEQSSFQGAQTLAFSAPPLLNGDPLQESEIQDLADRLDIARAEILAGSWCDNGPKWKGLLLKNRETLLGLKPIPSRFPSEKIGLATIQSTPQVEVRTFFQGSNGLTEDPVTGSFNAALAQWLLRDQWIKAPYLAVQGTMLGRNGQVTVTQSDQNIWIGGQSKTMVKGQLFL